MSLWLLGSVELETKVDGSIPKQYLTNGGIDYRPVGFQCEIWVNPITKKRVFEK